MGNIAENQPTYTPRGDLWLDSRGNVYATPFDRAGLEGALHLQRRITQHLAQLVIYLAAARKREARL